MRHAEITPELIKFSKRAKELGFPQDVEEGDWVAWDSGVGGISIHLIHETYPITDNDWLILSFSRCLEWLLEKHADDIEGEFSSEGDANIIVHWIDELTFTKTAKTHHEAIAKAVVKILEGEK